MYYSYALVEQTLVLLVTLNLSRFIALAPVVQKVDNVIHRTNQLQYPLDSAIVFTMTYPLDSDLFGG